MKKVILIALCAVLLMGVVLTGCLYTPQTQDPTQEPTNSSTQDPTQESSKAPFQDSYCVMLGYAIKPDGTVLEEFVFTIHIDGYDYLADRPEFSTSDFRWGNWDNPDPDDYAIKVDWGMSTFQDILEESLFSGYSMPNDAAEIFGTISYFSGKDFKFGTVRMNLREGTICMYLDYIFEDALIVGISDPNGDPMEVVKAFLDRCNIPNLE